MNGTKSRQLTMGICALAAAGLFAATQGCSSSNGTTGTGGTTGGGTGGKGTGGMTGGGVGGSTVDAGPPLCTGVPWVGTTAGLITDFSDAVLPDGGADYRIGTHGGTYVYAGTSAVVTAGKLTVTGTIAAGAYAGVGIYFDDCIDASSYTGFSFVLTGSLGTCDMASLGASFPQDQPLPATAGGGKGVCTLGGSCFGPGGTFSIASTMVPFTAMAGGSPVTTVTAEAQKRLDGINFGFHGPAGSDAGADASAGGCTVNFTIDDVKFY